MRLHWIAAALFLGAASGCSPEGGGGSGKDEAAVRAAYREYEGALKAGDVEKMKARMSAARAHELSAPDAAAGVAMAAQFRPSNAAAGACRVDGDRATLKLSGTSEEGKMEGEVTLVREGEAWKVDKESWTLKMDMGGAEEAPLPPDVPMPAAVKAIVDRVASADPMEGSKAWLELGARYQSSGAFLAEVKQALWDDRPVAFAIVEEQFKGSGGAIRYFTSKPGASGSAQPAATVGEALRYHFWQYEDASGSGFKGTFEEWWSSWAPPKGLPAFGR